MYSSNTFLDCSLPKDNVLYWAITQSCVRNAEICTAMQKYEHTKDACQICQAAMISNLTDTPEKKYVKKNQASLLNGSVNNPGKLVFFLLYPFLSAY